MDGRRKAINGVWVVVALLLFAAAVGLGRALLLRDADRAPATAPQR